MSDQPDDNREELRAWAASVFNSTESPPNDIVDSNRCGPSAEDLRRQNDMIGTDRPVTIPGEIVTSPDGMPIGVGPSRTENVGLEGVFVTRQQLTDAGLTPDDVPNLTIIEE